MMKIPKKLKVGGRTYTITYPFIFKDTPRPLYGLHDAAGQFIKIAQKDEFGVDRHPESITHTVLHEFLHAIDNVYNGGRLTSADRGEEMIDSLSEGLLQVIRDNGLDFRGDKNET